MNGRNRKQSYYRSRPEQLEMRNLLSGHGFGGAFGFADAMRQLGAAAAAGRDLRVPPAVSGFFAGGEQRAFGHYGNHGAQGETLRVQLSDDTGQAATVTYRTYTENGETENELTVKVTGAEANSALPVAVD